MKTVSSFLQVIAIMVIVVLLAVGFVAVFQGMGGTGQPGAAATTEPTGQPYPPPYPTPQTTQPIPQFTLTPDPNILVWGPNDTPPPFPTWTPIPTFPPPPTPTRRPGPTATALPLPTPAGDAAGVIAYAAQDASNQLMACSLDTDASGTPITSPQCRSGNTPITDRIFISPDGSRAIVAWGWGLDIFYLATGQVGPLFKENLDPQGLFLSWHPDSRQVLIRAQQNYSDIGLWLVSVDTGEHTSLFVQVPSPNIDGGAVSPDGQKAVFVFQTGGIATHYEMWVVNTDGSDPKLIFAAPSLLAPLWSPDGTKIAFVGMTGLTVINADGSEERPLSQNHGLDIYFPNFAWSPDSQMIAVIALDMNAVHSSEWSTGNFTGATIHIVNMATGEDRPLFTDNITGNIDPAWSPDGSQIAFASTRSGKSEIWTVNVDGANLRQITNTDQIVRSPEWRGP